MAAFYPRDASERAPRRPFRDVVRELPLFLKIWITLQVVGFVVGRWLNPAPFDGVGWWSLIFWIGVAALLTHGMYLQSRFAWSAAIVLAGLQLFFALPPSIGLIPPTGPDAGRELAWSGFAAFDAVAQLVS